MFKINFFFFVIFILKSFKIKSNITEDENELFSEINKRNIVNEPIFPLNTRDFAVKKYTISKYNLSHPRYRFQEEYNNRKIFKINYSYFPYQLISKNNHIKKTRCFYIIQLEC